MRVPAFPSEHYRSLGCRPVYAYGLVLWLSLTQYTSFRKASGHEKYPDATDEQVASQDQWRESALAEEDREWAELNRIFRGAVDAEA